MNETTALAMGEQAYQQTKGLSFQNGNGFLLPPQPGLLYNDGSGTNTYDLGDAPVFEDDVVATNVRSFNIKAYDPSPRYINTATDTIVNLLPGYFDLGYIAGIDSTNSNGQFNPRFASGQFEAPTIRATSPILLDCFGHEGRMPPLIEDNRVDPQFPTLINNFDGTQRYGLGDNNTGVVRMRRVWDSWSTTYTNAPSLPIDPTRGPLNNYRPVTPSYPAPYPSALRGIEIQIRLTDPDDKRIKTMTIHQDFSESL